MFFVGLQLWITSAIAFILRLAVCQLLDSLIKLVDFGTLHQWRAALEDPWSLRANDEGTSITSLASEILPSFDDLVNVFPSLTSLSTLASTRDRSNDLNRLDDGDRTENNINTNPTLTDSTSHSTFRVPHCTVDGSIESASLPLERSVESERRRIQLDEFGTSTGSSMSANNISRDAAFSKFSRFRDVSADTLEYVSEMNYSKRSEWSSYEFHQNSSHKNRRLMKTRSGMIRGVHCTLPKKRRRSLQTVDRGIHPTEISEALLGRKNHIDSNDGFFDDVEDNEEERKEDGKYPYIRKVTDEIFGWESEDGEKCWDGCIPSVQKCDEENIIGDKLENRTRQSSALHSRLESWNEFVVHLKLALIALWRAITFSCISIVML